jgi:hypothetical protein
MGFTVKTLSRQSTLPILTLNVNKLQNSLNLCNIPKMVSHG